MRPAGVLKSIPGIEAAGALSPKTQSPSTLGWRLRVEVRHTRRSETKVGLDTPLGPHGQSPLPEGWIRYARYVHVHGQPPDRTVWNRRFRWYLVPRGSPLAIFRRSFFVWFGKPIVFNGLLH
jgi:hypothetical protein